MLKQKSKRLLCLLLSLTMVLSLSVVSLSVYADVVDGTEGATSTAVAKIGDTGYTSLAEAVSAATSGDTIILIGNATVDSTISVSTDVTLDLNGCTIEASTTLFKLADGGSLSVTDSSEGASGIINISTDSTSTVYFASGAGVNSTVAINSGTINVTSTGGKAVLIWNASVNISGGTFTVSSSTEAHGIYAKGGSISDGKLTVTANNAAVAANTLVSGVSGMIYGGTYNVSPENYLIATGYAVETNEDGTYTVVDKNVVTVTIGEETTYYTSILSALAAANAAESDAAITLTADIDLATSLTVKNTSSKTITLDLNGYTITTATDSFNGNSVLFIKTPFTLTDTSDSGDGSLVVESATLVNVIENYTDNGSTVTLNGGTISFTSTRGNATTAVIKNGSSGTVVMNNGAAITATKSSADDSYSGTKSMVGISSESGTITLNGGTLAVSCGIGDATGISSSSSNLASVTVADDAEINVTSTAGNASGIFCAYVSMTGGTVSASSSNGTAYGIYGKTDSNGGDSTITDGAVYVNGSTNSCISGSITLTGGVYSQSTVKNWVASDYAVYDSGITDYPYIVASASSAARIQATDGSYTYYTTLQAAFDAATNDDTVQLLGNVTENTTVAKGKNITLDLNGYTLTGSGDYAIDVEGGTFTLKDSTGNGSVTREDSSGYVIYVTSSSSLGKAVFTLESGTITGGTSGGIYARGGTSTYKSTVNINGGTIANTGINGMYAAQYTTVTMTAGAISGNQRGVYLASSSYPSTFTMSGGTISNNTNETLNGGGVYVVSGNKFVMNGGVITGNKAAVGGGVYAVTKSNTYYFQFSGGAIYGNTAVTSGNDIYATNVNSYTNATILNASSMTDVSYSSWRSASDGTNVTDTTTLSGTVYLTAATGDETYDTYNVTYDANGGSGTAPTDSTAYTSGRIVTVAEAVELTKEGCCFMGWNTASDGTGTTYSAGNTFLITENVTLYAVWEETVAEVLDSDGNIVGSYTSLSSAVSGASSGQTVRLVNDLSLIGTISISTKDKDVTIDMNGHNITFNRQTSSSYVFTVNVSGSNATLTLMNSQSTGGNINNESNYAEMDCVVRIFRGHLVVGDNVSLSSTNGSGITLGGYSTAYNNGTIQTTVKINGGSVYGGVVGVAIYGDTKNTTEYGPILTVNSGSVSGGTFGISGNGTSTYGPTTININGGEISATNGTGIYQPQKGTLTVTAGTITGPTGIEMRSGTLNVSGGTITGTAATFTTVANGNGTTVDGAGISVSQHSTDNEINVNITGGEISGYYGIFEVNYNGSSNSSEVNISISGDDTKVTGTGSDAAAIYSVSVSGAGSTNTNATTYTGTEVSISGGTYSSAVASDYCAESYSSVENNDGTYTVKVSSITLGGSDTSKETSVTSSDVSGSGTNTIYVGVSADDISNFSTTNYPTTDLTYTGGTNDSGSYIFAGWYYYDTDNGYIAYGASDADDSHKTFSFDVAAYAKFVDANVLSVQCVITNGQGDDANTNYWRFTTSVDSLKFDSVGFTATSGENALDLGSTKVYYKLTVTAAGSKVYEPADFSSASKYVASALYTDSGELKTESVTVTPYWTTLDGTTVTGTATDFTTTGSMYTTVTATQL